MASIDLDDVPPKIAAQLTGLKEGEEVLLVQHGAVVARLIVATPPPAPAPDTDLPPEWRMREVFENFRSSVEDEF